MPRRRSLPVIAGVALAPCVALARRPALCVGRVSLRTMSRPVHVIGVSLDLGGNRRGVDMGPSAFRIAGLGERLTALGMQVVDAGDLVAPIPETKTEGDPSKKYIREIARVCDRLYKASLA